VPGDFVKGTLIPLDISCWKGEQMGEMDGDLDLVALVDLFPYWTGTEKGFLIAHLVDTFHARRGLHGQDAIVKELLHFAQTLLFA